MSMDLVFGERIVSGIIIPRCTSPLLFRLQHPLLFPKRPGPLHPRYSSLIAHGRKRDSLVQPVLKQPAAVEEEEELEEEEGYEQVEAEAEEYVEDFGDEIFVDDDEAFEDEFEVDDAKLYVGDGGEGGGISLAGTWWDKKALSIAEDVSLSFDGDLKIYAFKTTVNSIVRVRIEKLSSKYPLPVWKGLFEFLKSLKGSKISPCM